MSFVTRLLLFSTLASCFVAQSVIAAPPIRSVVDSSIIGAWSVTEIRGEDTSKEAGVWFVVTETGTLTGNTGVNQFAATVVADTDALTIQVGPSTTRASGSLVEMRRETELLSALQAVNHHQINQDGTLSLLDREKKVLMKATPRPPEYQLSTHVLDTNRGVPGDGVKVTLEKLQDNRSWKVISTATTNTDGRIGEFLPLFSSEKQLGIYRLTFDLAEYFPRQNMQTVFPEGVVVFTIADETHYHIPIIVTPYAVSTYRGS